MKNILTFIFVPALLIGISPGVSTAQTQPEGTDIVQDVGWPRQVSNSKATIVYYQPQVDKWDNYKKMEGRIAFAMTPAGGQEILGVASFKCDTKTDKDARTTYLHRIEYTDVRFPSLNSQQVAAREKIFRELMPVESESMSVDRIMADLENGKAQAQTIHVKNDPPHIFYSEKSAILLIVDGKPVLAPIDKTNLEFVVNTNWDLFRNKTDGQLYLLVDDVWLTSKHLDGPWTQTTALPADMSALPDGQNFDDVRKMVPPPAVSNAPVVFYNNAPAELLQTDGVPVYAKIDGTGLLYVTNSENDIFVYQPENDYYILLSGRWFRAAHLTGPWSYAGDKLPADFAKIPHDSPKSHVLASVPGTIEASDAVMLAQIPTTVVVNKAEAEAKAYATYDGTPKFAPIEGTSLQYATNTQEKVIKYRNEYYLCYQAVWFVSSSPNGPWKTADMVPAEIYKIPPSSPVYNVTYVTQTNATATTVESCTTAGYFGAFIVGATVGVMFGTAIVYGTGWYYPPYVYWGPGWAYPVYRPWPCTYGAGAVYNPWTGGWATGRRAYGPYGSAGTAAWYNPATGRYGRSASVQSWYGGRSAANTYNPWMGTYGHTQQGHNPYAQWGSSTVSNGAQWARSAHVNTAYGSAFTYRTSSGKQGVVRSGAAGTTVHTDNGVYAGHDGNVYRRNTDGSWSRYDNRGQWNRVNPPQQPQNLGDTHHYGNNPEHSGNTIQNLDRSQQSRLRGQEQSQRFRQFQRDGHHPAMRNRHW